MVFVMMSISLICSVLHDKSHVLEKALCRDFKEHTLIFVISGGRQLEIVRCEHLSGCKHNSFASHVLSVLCYFVYF